LPWWLGSEDTRAILGSLWLLVWLGGLGARVRRGFGAVRAVGEPQVAGKAAARLEEAFGPEDQRPRFCLSDEQQRFRDFFRTNLHRALRCLDAGPSQTSLAKFPIVRRGHCQVFLGKNPFPNWREALEWAGTQLSQFRAAHRGESGEIREWLLNDGPAPQTPVSKAGFGLPLPFYFRSVEKAAFRRLANEALRLAGGHDASSQAAQISREPRRQWEAALAQQLQRLQELRGSADGERARKQAKSVVREASAQAKATVAARDHDRRSSPLWLRVVRAGPQAYYVIVLFFESLFLPEPASNPAGGPATPEPLVITRLRGAPSQVAVQQPDHPYALVERFLSQCVAAHCEEIMLP